MLDVNSRNQTRHKSAKNNPCAFVIFKAVPEINQVQGIISSYACSFSTFFCVCEWRSYVFFFFYRKA